VDNNLYIANVFDPHAFGYYFLTDFAVSKLIFHDAKLLGRLIKILSVNH